MKSKGFFRLIVAGILLIWNITPVHSAMPLWTFSAPNPATITVSPGETATVQYTVTNQSMKSKILLLKSLPGLSATSCILPGKGSTCILTLTANGSEIPANGIHMGPILCDLGNLNQCYQPSASNLLQVNVTKSILPINFTTVGYYDNGSTLVPLAYTSRDNGATWSLSNTLPPPIPATNSILQGVSCNSSNNCVAAGNYGTSAPLTYTSSDYGANWNISSILPPAQGGFTQLNAISCDNSGHCAAAGFYVPGVMTSTIYNSSDSGDTWAISTLTNPYAGTEDLLNGVTCANSGNCVAVGYEDNGFSGRQALTATSNDFGVNWAFSSLLANDILFGVSCDDSGHCAAVGISPLTFPQRAKVYISNNNGANWIASAPLTPQGPSTNSLISVSCLNSGKCVTVGDYFNGVATNPLSYISDDFGANWTLSAVLPPPQGIGNNIMRSVSCLSTGFCSAVGSYVVGAVTHPLTYTSQDYGNTWAVSTTLPQAQGSGDNALNGVN